MSGSPQRHLEDRISPADTLKFFACVWGIACIAASFAIANMPVRWGAMFLGLVGTILCQQSESRRSTAGLPTREPSDGSSVDISPSSLPRPPVQYAAGLILMASTLIANHLSPRDGSTFSQTSLLAADIFLISWVVQFIVSVPLRQNPLRWASLNAILSFGAIALSPMLSAWNQREDSVTSTPAKNSSLRWVCQTCPQDPDLTCVRVPHSRIYAYYPDDPNHYFRHRTSPDWLGPIDLRTFSIVTFGPEHQARLLLPEENDGLLRVESHLPTESRSNGWHIILRREGIEIFPHITYRFSFQARGQAGDPVIVDIHRTDVAERIELTKLDFVLADDWAPYSITVGPNVEPGLASIEFHLQRTPGFLELRDAAIEITGDDEARKQLEVDRCYVEFVINSAGFRDIEHPLAKPAGVKRIALLGDSMTEGWGVHFEDLAARQWQKILNEDVDLKGQKFEVLNFGMSGYASRQERILYEKVVRAYAPDLVVVLFCFNDDMSAYEENQYRLRIARDPQSVPPSIKNRVRLDKQSDFQFASAIEELKQLHLACQQDQARLVVALFRQNSGYPWDEWDARLRQSLSPIGIDIIDLGKNLENRLELNVHAVDGHPNHRAHRIAAEQLHHWLKADHSFGIPRP